MADARRGEFGLIAELFVPLTDGDPRALSLKDDAAVLPQRDGIDTVVTSDTMVAGVHFLMTERPEIIARRLLRANLSDLASMAAIPTGYFLNLTPGDDIDDAWLDAFARGLRADQDQYKLSLLGGDTTHTTGPLVLSVTMMGEVPAGSAVNRAGARAGDLVVVSGTIGDAVLGLSALSSGDSGSDQADLTERFQLPTPRLALGQALRGIASAMADVSDGLVADVGHICAASGVSAKINAAQVPLSPPARNCLAADRTDIAALITGGDDYELVFTVTPGNLDTAKSAAEASGVQITVIGEMGAGAAAVSIIDEHGARLNIQKAGYRHF